MDINNTHPTIMSNNPAQNTYFYGYNKFH